MTNTPQQTRKTLVSVHRPHPVVERMVKRLYPTLQSPQPWHKRAKRNIWMEASGLIAAGVVYAISVGFLELTHRGGGTPLIPLAAMVGSTREEPWCPYVCMHSQDVETLS